MLKKILGYIFLVYILLVAAFALTAIVYHEKLKPEAPIPLPDFTLINDAETRKRAFFDYLSPIVEKQNNRLLKQRQRIINFSKTFSDNTLSKSQIRRLDYWASKWDVAEDLEAHKKLEVLLIRVDSLPRAMVLAQAANESGWGRSRFAREANNLFGQWCFKPGCGMVPEKRAHGAIHEVRKFASIEESISAYLYNINTHKAYKGVRDIRAALRADNKPVTGLKLIEGLGSYSERGSEYIAELKRMIKSNKLE